MFIIGMDPTKFPMTPYTRQVKAQDHRSYKTGYILGKPTPTATVTPTPTATATHSVSVSVSEKEYY